MYLRSMTGFAALGGEHAGTSWQWEIRSVNGRGLDLRLRLPEGAEALEPALRKTISKGVARGNIAVALKPVAAGATAEALVDPARLAAVLDAASRVEAAAQARGMVIAPMSAAEILQMESLKGGTVDASWVAKAGDQIEELLGLFDAARAAEGAAIAAVLAGQIDRIADLVAQADAAAQERGKLGAEVIRERVALLLGTTDAVDETRLAQELALIAVKADITEELDRLRAHVDAARDLVAQKGPMGRKFDFLTQEFNREANTLCSKSGSTALTAIGLELKVIIDQMREQVQNLE